MDTSDDSGQTCRFTRLVVDAGDAVLVCEGRNTRLLRSLVEPTPHPLVHLLLTQARHGETVEITSCSGIDTLPSMLMLQAVPLPDGHVQLTTTRFRAAAPTAEPGSTPPPSRAGMPRARRPFDVCALCPKGAWCTRRHEVSGVVSDHADACLLDLFST